MPTKRQLIRNLITAVIATGLLGLAVNATQAQAPHTFLLMDEDSIDNTNPGYYLPPNTGRGDHGQPFTDSDVNDNIARVGLRTPLSFFNNPANFGRRIVIRSGQVGDEALFALKVVPDSWRNTGPTNDGLVNYIGQPCQPFPHNVGRGLGRPGDDQEVLLDQIPRVTPLRATGLTMLIGKTIAALVYDSDVSINYSPLNGNLKGANLGVVAFKLLEVKKAIDFSTSTLPLLTIQIVDPCQAFATTPVLFLNAPEPTSSSEPFDVTPGPTPTPKLGNISTRLRVATGDNVLIGGFIVSGTQPKRVIVRGIGTSLPFADRLSNPTLELRDSSGALLDSNDNWVDSPNRQAIIDSTIPPSNDLESAIVATLPANNSGYTTILRGVNGGTGTGLVEAYDLDNSVDSQLANISTRGFVQTGDNVLIAGTIVVDPSSQRVIVRAIGPSLTMPGKLADPTLELYDANGALLQSNDNWRSDQAAEIIATTIPPSHDAESAMVATLTPAAYTAIVRGSNGTTGVALVEVYALN